MILSIGIDVAKSKLDIFMEGKQESVSNDKRSIKKYFRTLDKGSRIVLEATGKYHRLAHEVLVEMGFPVMVINPYQSRYFARALNIICKTDAVDARVLSLYGERMPFKATEPLAKRELEMQELSRHLDDLKKIKKDLSSRKRESTGFVAKSLDKPIKALDDEIRKTEEALKGTVKEDDKMQSKVELLESIPGVGTTTAIMLLSYLRELGSVSKTEISALAGLAPMNNDSGVMRGKRSIQRGRKDVRCGLYMPVVGAATMHNARLKAFYERLSAKGKPKKVVLTACMRKLVVWANAILESNQPWVESYA